MDGISEHREVGVKCGWGVWMGVWVWVGGRREIESVGRWEMVVGG